MKNGLSMRIAGALVSLAILGAACSSGDGADRTSGPAGASATTTTTSGPGVETTVEVVIELGSLTASAPTAPAGTVRFEVTSIASSGGSHSFGVWRTDIAPGELPLTTLGEAFDPTAEGIEVVGFLARFRGEDELEVELAPGSHILICSVHLEELASFEVT